MCSFVANGAVTANPRDSLPLDVWTGVVDDVAPWRPYMWFTGGEPTLYPDIIPLIRHIKSRRLLCGMTTNGTTLERWAESIAMSSMDLLVVSIDGRGEVHNQVRGNPKAFERACGGVEALQDAKRRLGTHKPAVIVNCALTPANVERATDMIEVARSLGALALHYQHLWMMTSAMISAHNDRWGREQHVSAAEWGGDDASGMNPAVVVDAVRRIKAARSPIPVLFQPDLTPNETHVYYNEPATFVRRRPAACAWINTDILPTGDVSPCFGVVCGNIARHRFSDVWNGARFVEHRLRLGVEGDLPICARCCAYWRRD
jgi:MoaA/NifB/PqqE/SkfB family radical SAM enzyme